jgi:hypothetical protein
MVNGQENAVNVARYPHIQQEAVPVIEIRNQEVVHSAIHVTTPILLKSQEFKLTSKLGLKHSLMSSIKRADFTITLRKQSQGQDNKHENQM